jgi:thymidylate synthase (FAD)
MPATAMAVELIQHMGEDITVVDAARVSFNKRSAPVVDPETEEMTLSTRDNHLVHYLARNNHWTTFGHCAVTLRVKAPIFVARQLVKHQVGLVWNEVSRRYVDNSPEYWLPRVLHCRPDGSIKQGSGEVHYYSAHWINEIEQEVLRSVDLYDRMIWNRVAPEEARIVLNLNCMTEWWWTGSLAAWGRVCKLRLDPHAQGATREVAELISDHMKKLYPIAWDALLPPL